MTYVVICPSLPDVSMLQDDVTLKSAVVHKGGQVPKDGRLIWLSRGAELSSHWKGFLIFQWQDNTKLYKKEVSERWSWYMPHIQSSKKNNFWKTSKMIFLWNSIQNLNLDPSNCYLSRGARIDHWITMIYHINLWYRCEYEPAVSWVSEIPAGN